MLIKATEARSSCILAQRLTLLRLEQRKFLEGDTLYTLVINCDTSRVFLFGVGPKKKVYTAQEYLLNAEMRIQDRYEAGYGLKEVVDMLMTQCLVLIVFIFFWYKYSH